MSHAGQEWEPSAFEWEERCELELKLEAAEAEELWEDAENENDGESEA